MRPRIQLTEQEELVFGILLGAAEKSGLEGLTIRAAGGWVRDKLLGLESDDIDIAVDRISGEEFAHMVSFYVAHEKMGSCSKTGVVKQNPDQSKHLATACFSVCGLTLDVNQLRTETYTEKSRIPHVEVGTASGDAHRRDFTVNTLFYNLHTHAVEDHVGCGLQDMQAGRICTPQPPLNTFIDDPLRLLRVVRFAVRLGFDVDEGVLDAARQAKMAKLLASKVSRERIGIEMDKIFNLGSSRVCDALDLMADLQLLGPVFLPEVVQERVKEGQPPAEVAHVLTGIGRVRSVMYLLGPDLDLKEVHLAAFAALLSPWTGLCYREKKRMHPLAHGVLRHGLKFGNDVSKLVPAIIEAADGLLPLVRREVALEEKELKLQVGRCLLVLKELWPIALALAISIAHGDADSVEEHALSQDFQAARSWVESSGLLGCWEWKPFLGGKQLMEAPFNVPKGKQLGTFMDVQLQWRMEDPLLSGAACEQQLLKLIQA